ncbi:glycosyltransferase family 2 protein [Desulfonatronum sp. SC1]|uniref:glycosyltransferase family 2 protein n=1 Tax=Desulfonatronum sp. SC1 TaxID=2109626 RepID=UPI000D301D21|nr:glycosyltransferase [Desulfonatronum sp. SC1]PTN33805.1 hypothetical protein C6366_14045 [Desulfonatronum sp. SC1]
MNDNAVSMTEIIDAYQRARRLYEAGSFSQAEREIVRYKSLVDYGKMRHEDRRPHGKYRLSVIIVSYAQGQELINCLDSLRFPKGVPAEIILIDNGGNESIHAELKNRPLLHFQSPINFAPSEGRNIGAHFATGEILVFVDDDCVVAPRYIDSILLAFDTFHFSAIRGRVKAKSPGGNASAPRHYDLGDYPLPAPLLTEGNMAVSKNAYMAVGGMHPLMFGLEGVEFSWRLFKRFSDRDIYYWPGMIIHHDHVNWDGRIAKKKRHAIARQYLRKIMGSHADLRAQYTRWYDDRPGPLKHYESRSALARMRHAVMDALAIFLYRK